MPMQMPLTQKQLYRRMCVHGGGSICRRENNKHAQDHGATRKHVDSVRAPRESVDGAATPGAEEEGGRSNRSVSFDETARVVLVPTRHELLALQARLQQQAQQPNTTGGDPRWDESIWWTRNDCRQFRRSFRKQIFAHGLQNHGSFLLTDDMIFGLEKSDGEMQTGGAPMSPSPTAPIVVKD